MKTVRLVKLEDSSYMTEDGMFVVRYHVGMGSYPKGWSVCSLNDTKFITYVTYAKALSSLRCARVWIKNFYRTMTFERADKEVADFASKLQYRTMYEAVSIAMCELVQEKPRISNKGAVRILQKENMDYALNIEDDLLDAEIMYQTCVELAFIDDETLNRLAR